MTSSNPHTQSNLALQSSTISIVENCDDFVIINKACGTSFHNESKYPGLFVSLEKQLDCKLWPIHRLDKITSGLLLFAKSKVVASEISEIFANKKITKVYLAISDKKPKKKQGSIIGDMKKSRGGNWILSQQKSNPAKTRFHSISMKNGKRLFWLMPETGKTHQLRVALKSLGAAILGDTRYGGNQTDRGYLHAYQLAFTWRDKNFQFSALPEQGDEFRSSLFFETLPKLAAKAVC